MDEARSIFLFAILLVTFANMGIFMLYEFTSGAKIDSDKVGDFSSLQSCTVSFDTYLRDLRRETGIFRVTFSVFLVNLLLVGVVGLIFLGGEEEVQRKKRQAEDIKKKNAENVKAEARTYMETMSYYEEALKTAFEKMDTEMARKQFRLNREALKVQEKFTSIRRFPGETFTTAFNEFTDKWTECNKYFMMRKNQPIPRTFGVEARLFREDAKMVDSLEKSLKLVQHAEAEMMRQWNEQQRTKAEKEEKASNNELLKAADEKKNEEKESYAIRTVPIDNSAKTTSGNETDLNFETESPPSDLCCDLSKVDESKRVQSEVNVIRSIHKKDICEGHLECKSESVDGDTENDSNKKSEDKREECDNFNDNSGNNVHSRKASDEDLEYGNSESTDDLVDDSKSDDSASDDFFHV